MGCSRPFGYLALSKSAKASADRAYAACKKAEAAKVQARQESRADRVQFRQEARVGVAEATGTTGAQVLYGELGDIAGQALGAFLPGAGAASNGSSYGPPAESPKEETPPASDWTQTVRDNPIPVAIGAGLILYALTR